MLDDEWLATVSTLHLFKTNNVMEEAHTKHTDDFRVFSFHNAFSSVDLERQRWKTSANGPRVCSFLRRMSLTQAECLIDKAKSQDSGLQQ